jgi:hypothetical protein
MWLETISVELDLKKSAQLREKIWPITTAESLS